MNRPARPWLSAVLSLLLLATLLSAPPATAGATVAAGAPAAASAAPDAPQPGQFYPVRGRVASALDVAAGATATVKVAGVAGVPATGVASVALSVAAKGTGGAGSLVTFPSGAAEPAVTALTYRSDLYVHNLLTVKTGTDGNVRIANKGAVTVRLYADVYGYTLTAAGAAAGSVFVAVSPDEVADTTIAANGSLTVYPLREAGIARGTISHVALTLSAAGGSTTGKLTVFPTGTAKPAEVNLDYGTAAELHNYVISGLGADGSVTITNTGSGVAKVMVDLAGYFVAPSATAAGATLRPLQPARIAANVAINAGAAYTLAPLGKGGVPASGVWSVGLSLTVKGADASCCNALQVYASGEANAGGVAAWYEKGVTGTAFVAAKLGADGKVIVYNNSTTKATVQIDVFAYFTGPGKPGAPTAVTGVARHQAVRVSWQPPASDGGTPITGYTVTVTPGGRTVTTAGATTANVTGLSNGTAYTFTVTAANAVGTGPASAASAAVTPVQGRLPGAPIKIVTAPEFGSVHVSWQPPTDDGGADITEYKVVTSPGGETAKAWWGQTEVTVKGLTDGQLYTFAVTATNVIGAGPSSAPSPVTAPAAPTSPGAPLITDLLPRDGAVRVTWSPPDPGNGKITSYVVTASPGGKSVTTGPDEYEAVVTGLTNGSPYAFTVTAVNVVGSTSSRASPLIAPEPASVPFLPAALLAVPLDGRIDAQWVAPQDGGSPITGYTVTLDPGGRTLDVAAGTTVASLTGLTNGTSYTVRVVARNAAGTSEAAQQAGVVPQAARVPAAPTEAQAAATGAGTVALTWTAPADVGTAPVTGYTVTADPGGRTVTSTGTTATMTGLDPALSYGFTVKAANTHGSGAPSARTPAIVPKVTVQSTPVVLSDASLDTLRTSAADGTLSFEQPPAQVTGLAANAIVVVLPTAKVPDGLFRRVVSTGTQNGLFRVATKPATAGEALADGAVAVSAGMDAGDLARLQQDAPGVRLRGPTIKGKTLAEGAAQAKVSVKGVSAGIRNGSLVVEIAVGTDPRSNPQGKGGRFEATFVLTPHMDLKLWMTQGKVYFDTYLSLAYGADTRVRLGNGADADYFKRLPAISLGRKVVWAGPVPVVMNPTFNISTSLQSHISGEVSAGLKYARQVGAHIMRDDTGVHAEPIDRSPASNGGSITITGNANAKIALLAEFTLIFYEGGGPGVGVGPTVEWKADTTKNPWWEEWLGIRVDAYLRASTWLGGGETRFDRLVDQSWKTRDAGGGFTGIAVDPPRADVEVGKPVYFKVTFFGLPTAPVTWKVTAGPGAIDAAGKYVADRPGVAEITATTSGRTVSALVFAQCWLEASPPALGMLGPPLNVAATAGAASATVTWDPPRVLGGLPVRRYALITSPPSRTTYVPADRTSAVVQGLRAGQAYNVIVYAITDVAMSPPSSSGGSVTPTN
ncbi:fibronectin type III domain-containing protein [Nonomuraea sp. NPDC049758]|uniref:fibronectin type III domain-containing protein n=1 Tax=Nonomuraea sp. NPDC049758 TaxID=3154360 RepID=UPI00341E5BE2